MLDEPFMRKFGAAVSFYEADKPYIGDVNAQSGVFTLLCVVIPIVNSVGLFGCNTGVRVRHIATIRYGSLVHVVFRELDGIGH